MSSLGDLLSIDRSYEVHTNIKQNYQFLELLLQISRIWKIFRKIGSPHETQFFKGFRMRYNTMGFAISRCFSFYAHAFNFSPTQIWNLKSALQELSIDGSDGYITSISWKMTFLVLIRMKNNFFRNFFRFLDSASNFLQNDGSHDLYSCFKQKFSFFIFF